ncbi:hypothetical protein LJR118_002905 [Acidovorax sp. LjRoot118]|uniref:hypothetical protein n=1 Tax=unclassified Acidovorax TaxID=2684926 RepID=UPI0012FCCBC9|nr:hypothetical protein [Acidovorax sp. Root217]
MARSTIPSKARRLLAALALALPAAAALAADMPADILELHTRCVASTTGIDLVFGLRNRSERTVWVSGDTAPWAAALRSLRITAESQGANAQPLKGPVAWGYAPPPGSVRVMPSASAEGTISLSRAFPELAQAAQQAPVRIRWTWQGLMGESAMAGAWGPTARFEGEVTVQGSACSLASTRRV